MSVRTLPPDPLGGLALAEFGALYRRGEVTSAAVTEAYLARIAALDPKLRAFEHVAAESARATARALDAMLAAGTDLGPLMGVPVAVKDLFAVDGMPTTAGSRVDVSALTGTEGSFVGRLRRAGCVILGKTKTVEFAFGAVGTNAVRGMPRNPWDASVERIPGGSSSGSAVAVAASLCAFAVGSDTGGSVRLPAALCGVFGLKTTVGRWATDGVFPLAPTFDSIGLLTRTAADAALAFSALEHMPMPSAGDLGRLRFGVPQAYLCEGLDDQVRDGFQRARAALSAAGATLDHKEMLYAAEREGFFGPVLAVELLASLGRERFLEVREAMDPVIAARTTRGLDLPAIDYVRMIARHRALRALADDDMAGIDAWLTPTAASVAADVRELADPDKELALVSSITRNTQPMNLFGQCGTTTPINGTRLPVGLQITCPPLQEARALSIAMAIEELIGKPPLPDVSAFLEQTRSSSPAASETV